MLFNKWCDVSQMLGIYDVNVQLRMINDRWKSVFWNRHEIFSMS